MPGHPWTTLLFIAAQWMIVVSTFAHDPLRASIGLMIALAGLPIYFSLAPAAPIVGGRSVCPRFVSS